MYIKISREGGHDFPHDFICKNSLPWKNSHPLEKLPSPLAGRGRFGIIIAGEIKRLYLDKISLIAPKKSAMIIGK